MVPQLHVALFPSPPLPRRDRIRLGADDEAGLFAAGQREGQAGAVADEQDFDGVVDAAAGQLREELAERAQPGEAVGGRGISMQQLEVDDQVDRSSNLGEGGFEELEPVGFGEVAVKGGTA